jgi:hypothetical protein
VVTFRAEICETLPISYQWRDSNGGEFAAVAPDATNSVLVITNARISDSGLYALFATNALGAVHTTPVPLIVVEGTD